MNLENLKYEFPQMPEEMRKMVEREVNKQLRSEPTVITKKHKTAKRTLVASVAAVMLLGTTTYAGMRAYRLYQEQTGAHGVAVKISENSAGTDAVLADTQKRESLEIPNVKMSLSYLPEGMVETDEGKYSYSDALYQGGVSIAFYRMDTGDDAFMLKHNNVLTSENISVNGHDGVYLEYPHLFEDEISFNRKIYVAYTDVHYVMEMYVASDVTKEDAIKIAQGLTLTPTEETDDIVSAWDWSSYLASMEEQNQSAEQDAEPIAASKEDMKHTHAIGETFSSNNPDTKDLTLRVADVQVSDDISLLDLSVADDSLKEEADENNKLRPAEIQYIKDGNSDTLSEVIKSRQVAQKLVYVTVEYTNTGDQEMTDVLFLGSLARIYEEKDNFYIKDSLQYETPSDDDQWNTALNKGLSSLWEMQYYDVFGGERHNNYIERLAPNETATVHMGWIVTEEELDQLYLNLDTYGGMEFSDSSLQMGFVDLRQPN